MRLSNYRGRESAARPLFSFFFLSAFPFFFSFFVFSFLAGRRAGSTRGADSRLFGINRRGGSGGSGRAVDLRERLLYLY